MQRATIKIPITFSTTEVLTFVCMRIRETWDKLAYLDKNGTHNNGVNARVLDTCVSVFPRMEELRAFINDKQPVACIRCSVKDGQLKLIAVNGAEHILQRLTILPLWQGQVQMDGVYTLPRIRTKKDVTDDTDRSVDGDSSVV